MNLGKGRIKCGFHGRLGSLAISVSRIPKPFLMEFITRSSEWRVAGPGLEGGKVAVPSSYAVLAGHVTSAAYSGERGGRITQLQYLSQLSLRTSKNPQKAKFAESAF